MIEYWDLYDINRNSLGRKHERGKPMETGTFHIVVNILSINNDGKILITKRHESKPHGNKWEITGGSVVAGEKSVDGAVRELHEETGLTATPGQLVFRGTIIREPSGCLHDFYLFRKDFCEKDIVLQENETTDFRLVDKEELLVMAREGKFLDFLYERLFKLFPEIFKPLN